MHGRTLARCAAVIALAALGACAGLRASPRSPIADHGASIARLEGVYAADRVADCLESADAGCRDRIVQALMIAVDLRYADFELGFFDTNRYAGFGATLATLGLGAAGAVSSGGAAQVMAATIAAITGAREAFNREVLAEQTASALLTAMRAARNIVRRRIQDGLAEPVARYPLGIALADTYAYFRAGTIPGALSEVTQTIGVQGEAARQALSRPGTGLSQSAAARALRAWLNAPGLTQDERDQRLLRIRDAARSEGSTRAVGSLIRDETPENEAILARVADRLRLLP